MNTIQIGRDKIISNFSIDLPLSKSISNRLLIMGFLSHSEEKVRISSADDSRILRDLIRKLGNENESKFPSKILTYDTGDAGTAYRFLCALFACKIGERILTGSSRMRERPIAPLITVLNKLGAECEFLSKSGYPPVKIIGKRLKGGIIDIDSQTSSQFISALMMIAPYIENGLDIKLTGKPVSFPYIRLTAELMKKCGVKVDYNEREIHVFNGEYMVDDFGEADWSAASYWYAYVAICLEPIEIKLKGLSQQSFQGDKIISNYFQYMGVHSYWENGDLIIKKEGKVINELELNLKPNPDLLPSLAIAAAALQINAIFTGLETLVIKESNRLVAVKNELTKLGYSCICTDKVLIINKGKLEPLSNRIETYNDHRITMAFSLLALIDGDLIIENPETVNKSYPSYWDDIRSSGLKLSSLIN